MLARSRSGRACVATGGSLVLQCTRTAAPAGSAASGASAGSDGRRAGGVAGRACLSSSLRKRATSASRALQATRRVPEPRPRAAAGASRPHDHNTVLAGQPGARRALHTHLSSARRRCSSASCAAAGAAAAPPGRRWSPPLLAGRAPAACTALPSCEGGCFSCAAAAAAAGATGEAAAAALAGDDARRCSAAAGAPACRMSDTAAAALRPPLRAQAAPPGAGLGGERPADPPQADGCRGAASGAGAISAEAGAPTSRPASAPNACHPGGGVAGSASGGAAGCSYGEPPATRALPACLPRPGAAHPAAAALLRAGTLDGLERAVDAGFSPDEPAPLRAAALAGTPAGAVAAGVPAAGSDGSCQESRSISGAGPRTSQSGTAAPSAGGVASARARASGPDAAGAAAAGRDVASGLPELSACIAGRNGACPGRLLSSGLYHCECCSGRYGAPAAACAGGVRPAPAPVGVQQRGQRVVGDLLCHACLRGRRSAGFKPQSRTLVQKDSMQTQP